MKTPAPLTVYPKNGLGNRFRAMSSAHALSTRLGRPLKIVWEPYDGLPARWNQIFDPDTPIDFLSAPQSPGPSQLGNDVPPYLNVAEEEISLRGHNKGEQVFIQDFVREAIQRPQVPALIVAGDYFTPDVTDNTQLEARTRDDRRSFQSLIKYHSEVIDIARVNQPVEPYLGIHLRGGDRRNEVPSFARLLRTALGVALRNSLTEVFICSDNAGLRTQAVKALKAEGLRVWFDSATPDRRSTEGVLHACADFLNLQKSAFFVGPKSSTFSTEASIFHSSEHKKLVAQRRFFN